ncbi:MAG: 3-methyladenine DNA glycosylase [Bacteroidetes bacterium RIFCSPLOWO2_12_FULL_35_15]|nr:MAG: 3-methyladenine DNA glycosylase [Bacteroidetes bacterium RIFCSPLOWO2_12_FULL_35_15]
MTKLKKDFYVREDVVQIAKDLLGKYLFTKIDGKLTAGIITETEAYAGITDKASHAYNNRRTNRTEIMFAEGGLTYVYLCYGIHHLFNVVTNIKDVPHAVLIRAVKPVEGIDVILKRRNIKMEEDISLLLKNTKNKIAGGPGTVSQALGIKTKHSGFDLTGDKIWIEDKGIKISKKDIITTPRIGVGYAGEDAKLLYRFVINL